VRSSGNPNTNNSSRGMDGMNMLGQSPTRISSSRNMSQMGEMENMSSSGSMIDVLRVQMEINELQNNLALLDDTKIPLIARFNQLLNRDKIEPVIFLDSIVAATMSILLNEIPDSIINNNPMLKMLEQEEGAYIAQGKMNQKMGLPMFGLGLQYDLFRPRDNSESMMNGRNMLMPMATVTIPLWRKKYTASVRESDFMRQSVIEQKQDVSNQLMVSYEDALKDYRDAERRVKLYQDQTSLANQALNILFVQYSTEGSNFEEVLRMQQQLLDYRLKYLDAVIDGNIAVAMMERLMGR
jgi:outer membrane protein TolC